MLKVVQKGARNGQGGSRRLRAQEESERARADSKLCQAHALTSAGEDRCGCASSRGNKCARPGGQFELHSKVL